MTKNQKPNVLFVFSDQHRWCDLGCYGNTEVQSPNFDAFAQKAAIFNNCISNTPVCVPARGSILTGTLPMKHKAISNDLPIDTTCESIATVMNEDGYHTGYVGKWHLGGVPRKQAITKERRLDFSEWKVCNCNHDYLNAYYYDENDQFVEVDGYEPITQTDLAIDFIERNTDKPWGLVLSWGPPHDPYQFVPQQYLDMYKDLEPEMRPNVKEKIRRFTDVFIDKEDFKQNIQGYYAHITALDEQFGRLIKTLEATNQLDNTIIVYTSDHGDMLGSQGETNKQFYYEESIKVPLMVYWKDKTIQTVSDELLGLVDLPVSLLSLLGLKFKSEVDGTDVHELFTEKEAKGLDSCYIMDLIACHQAYKRGTKEWRGIKTKQYTYAIAATGEELALYDNVKDPYQMNNVMQDDDYTAIKKQLRKQLDQHIKKNDRLLPYEEFINEFGLKEVWNKSQEHFNLPQIN